LVALADRVYRRLLVLYPARFRREFGAEMARTFRACRRDAYADAGIAGFARCWLTTLCDLVVSAGAERLTEGIHMTRSRGVRLGALALVAGAAIQLVFALNSLAVALIQFLDMDGAKSLDVRTGALSPIFVAQIASWELAPLPFLLLGAGLVGLHLLATSRLGQRGASFVTCALIGLVLFVMGNVAFALFIHSQSTGCVSPTDCNFYDPDRVLQTSAIAQLAGLALFTCGLVCYGSLLRRARALPWGNALPVALGVVAPLSLVVQAGAAVIAPHSDYAGNLAVDLASSTLAAVQIVIWLLLARALLRGAKNIREPEAPAPLAALS